MTNHKLLSSGLEIRPHDFHGPGVEIGKISGSPRGRPYPTRLGDRARSYAGRLVLSVLLSIADMTRISEIRHSSLSTSKS